MSKYKEYKNLNLPQIGDDVLKFWKENQIFEKSVSTREGAKPFVFYEGPPSANGLPGIHHVMARAIKDIFCRYKTLQGFQVKRKAGWDTHGLPVELGVEKAMGITKEDIGKTISVEEYNKACRTDVMKYTHIWNDLTEKMGYWVDMNDPYITYENDYIESVWALLKRLYSGENPLKQNLLYKGYSIQPYSPAAGTGLSSHELNQPGCYRDVKDRTAVAMFKVVKGQQLKGESLDGISFLAWTTTPWTLPSNTALAVGKNIEYVFVYTRNPFTKELQTVIVAKELFNKLFTLNIIVDHPDLEEASKISDHKERLQFLDSKGILDQVKGMPVGFQIGQFKGSELAGIRYEQLLPFVQPEDGDAFKVIIGDFVTTEDGTGIVHIAPSFGADDFRVAKQNGIGSLTLVDKRGKFLPEIKDGVFLYGEEYVKEAYLNNAEKEAEYKNQKQILEATGKIKDLKAYISVDERIVLKLQEEGKLFKKETYEHSYPHCWRTDKPVLYYPLDSWFIKTTAAKDRLIELNKTINWKPESTGTGRFGNWLENLNDWNLSRSRYWGIPLPIWRNEDGSEEICIGSVEELKSEIAKSIAAGVMKDAPAHFHSGEDFDLHKPFVDEIVLVSASGKPMHRESDLIDVWFDSGAMPYAQLHYPFENKDLIDDKKYFPADFIAEGVDQTRGWFFTLHAISVMLFDSVAYKNVVSNGLVLDKNGNKMSKRLGNAVDPFTTLTKYGPDATRWYMIANAAPWDNLKFDIDSITEVQRKLFGTLYNTYGFFAIYANIDAFEYNENNLVANADKGELDRWIISKLNSLVADVESAFENYEPHRAARLVEEFVDEHLSNWYIRLSRRRFWKGEMSNDKKAAYETLYECLKTTAQLMSPIAPFFAEWMYKNLTESAANKIESIHLTHFTKVDKSVIDKALEERMDYAQKISSMVLSIRKKENLKVRQPLQKIQIPIFDDSFKNKVEAVKDLILSEVNVKELEFVTEAQVQIVKNIKLNFKTLGKKYGKQMKAIQNFVNDNSKAVILGIERDGKFELTVENENLVLENEDVEIIPVDIPGWKVANSGSITVALDVTLSEALKEEGLAREVVNRIQNIRKESNLEVTDKIFVKIQNHALLNSSINNNLTYICTEILAERLEIVNELSSDNSVEVEVENEIKTFINVTKMN